MRTPLTSATGETIGAALALRSLSAETAPFRRFRNVLVAVSLGVMVLGLLAAWGAASRITGPVRKLVGLVERIRDGSYSGAVAVAGPRRDRRAGARLQRARWRTCARRTR